MKVKVLILIFLSLFCWTSVCGIEKREITEEKIKNLLNGTATGNRKIWEKKVNQLTFLVKKYPEISIDILIDTYLNAKIIFCIGRNELIPRYMKGMAAYKLLLEIGKPVIDDLLEKYKKAEDEWEKKDILHVLNGIFKRTGGKEFFDEILKIAKEEKEEIVVNEAIEILGEIGKEKAIPFLIQTLNKSNGEMVYYVEPQFLRIGISGIKPLIEVLKNSELNRGTREAAAYILSKFGEPAVNPLISLLESGEDDYTRYLAIFSLGRIKDSRALNPIKKYLYDENKEIQEIVIETLGEIGTRKELEDLRKIKEVSKWLEIKRKAKRASIKIKFKKFRRYKWGKCKEGFKMSIYNFEEMGYFLGHKWIKIYVMIKNTSKVPKKLPISYLFFTLYLQKKNEIEKVFKIGKEEKQNGKNLEKDPFILSPGEIFSTSFTYNLKGVKMGNYEMFLTYIPPKEKFSLTSNKIGIKIR